MISRLRLFYDWTKIQDHLVAITTIHTSVKYKVTWKSYYVWEEDDVGTYF